MNNTFAVSFALKNTYRVNSILHSLKQVPLLGRILPDKLYQVRGLKIFANILAGLWELITVFLGKFLYLFVMVVVPVSLYPTPGPALFLHILLPLTVVGAFLNTFLFNPTRDKYYAIVLMRMDARRYALVDYGYAQAKVLLGFAVVGTALGRMAGLPLWACLLIPLFVAGGKLCAAASFLRDYERTGDAVNENEPTKLVWAVLGLLLAAAYLPPLAGLVLPLPISAAVMAAVVVLGLLAARKVFAFQEYRQVYQQILHKFVTGADTPTDVYKKQSEKAISADTAITSHRKGFAYLNDLFIKRHRKILWKAANRVVFVSLCIVLAILLFLRLVPAARADINEMLLVFLPYFTFIMFAINRGTGFTQALFMNCDHSLLTYSFYKQPKMVLALFGLRLREIIKINLAPALVVGGGLAALLYASGGTDDPRNYLVLFGSILCMSVFFSVHYLTVYYLLQPYNAGTEIKSGTYRLVLSVTYFVCFGLMQLRIPILLFGGLCIAFCVVYCAVACVLVYKLAPKTFRLRT